MNALEFIKTGSFMLPAYLAASSAWGAAECKTVAGHMNGKSVQAIRQVELVPNAISLSGTLNGVKSPRQTLPCKTIAKGVYCDAKFHGAIITVMTNGRQMIETVTDPVSNKEYASLAYECDRVMKP